MAIKHVFTHSYKTTAILFLLLAAGIYLRLNNQPTMWNTSTARDYLVAYHIYKYHEFPLIGHTAFGVNFYYPPLLFYALSLFMRVSSDYFFILTVFSLISAFCIVTVYFIGKNWCNQKVGLIAATFYTFSASMIYMGANTFTANIVVPPYLLSLLFFAKSLKDGKQKFLFFSLFTLYLASLINLTPLPYIFLFLLISVLVKKLSLGKAIFLSTTIIILFLLAQVPLAFRFGIPETLTAYSLSGNIQITTDAIGRFFSNIHSVIQLGYNFYQNAVSVTLVTILALTFIVVRKKPHALKKLWLPLAVMLMLPALAAIKKDSVYAYYFITSVPLIFLIYAYLIYVSISPWQKTVIRYVSLAIAVSLIFLSSKDRYGLLRYKEDYYATQIMAEDIIQNTDTYNFDVVELNNDSITYSPPTVYYFLEKMFGVKLLSVINDDFNLTVLHPVITIFLICLPVESEDWDEDACKAKFKKEYPDYHPASMSKIYPSYKNSVFKYTIDRICS